MAPLQVLYTDCCSSTAGYGELRCAGYVYAHTVHVLTLAHLACCRAGAAHPEGSGRGRPETTCDGLLQGHQGRPRSA